MSSIVKTRSRIAETVHVSRGLQKMARYLFVFVSGFFFTLIFEGFNLNPQQQFLTIHDFTLEPVSSIEVSEQFLGESWLVDSLYQKEIAMDELYQQKAFMRSLSNKSYVQRYHKSYSYWIEKRVCPDSPSFEKPIFAPMTSHYGYRVHPLSGRRHVHAGIDFRGQRGTPVHASAAGRVKIAGRKGAYGKTVIIDHGNSYTSLYGHLSEYTVAAGDWVNMGQTIGSVGRTGRATGPHLHFEVRCHNVPINPKKYLRSAGHFAEVKFKKYRPGLSPWVKHRRPAQAFKKSVSKAPSVKRSADYYTRMINLRKLHNLKSSKK